ncbi:nucleotidyltransferase family protein [Paenibacillus faecalis]|uniref:nucleotidyltransferase family protein n=1 Tax=Paenibacillus faecalis TaxID=2079532 RepID=UPI000D0E4F48|nr:nucleotidyltransferase family protein [Paenibacillus faecalis]
MSSIAALKVMELNSDLFNYLNKHSVDSNDLLNNIKRFGVERILKDYIKKIDPEEYKQILKDMKQKRKINKHFIDELNQLTNICEKRGQKLIHFKGITLAADLYHPIETRRFGDMDVLVDSDKLEEVLEIFNELGYKYAETQQSVSLNGYYIPVLEMLTSVCHIPEVYRTRQWNQQSYNIHCDIHVRIFNDSVSEWEYIKEVIDRAEKTEVLGNYHWLLEKHDRLIQLLCHFTKEHVDTTLKQLFEGRAIRDIRLSWLHETALFINKYSEELDWDVIIDRCLKWNKIWELLFGVLFLNRIYSDVINDSLIGKIKSHCAKTTLDDSKGLKHRALKSITDIDVNNILFGDIHNFYKNTIESVHWKGPIINCPRYTGATSPYNFIIEEIRSDTKTHIRRGSIIYGDPVFKTAGHISWDMNNIYITARVHDELFSRNKIENQSKDYFSVTFGNEGG